MPLPTPSGFVPVGEAADRFDLSDDALARYPASGTWHNFFEPPEVLGVLQLVGAHAIAGLVGQPGSGKTVAALLAGRRWENRELRLPGRPAEPASAHYAPCRSVATGTVVAQWTDARARKRPTLWILDDVQLAPARAEQLTRLFTDLLKTNGYHRLLLVGWSLPLASTPAVTLRLRADLITAALMSRDLPTVSPEVAEALATDGTVGLRQIMAFALHRPELLKTPLPVELHRAWVREVLERIGGAGQAREDLAKLATTLAALRYFGVALPPGSDEQLWQRLEVLRVAGFVRGTDRGFEVTSDEQARAFMVVGANPLDLQSSVFQPLRDLCEVVPELTRRLVRGAAGKTASSLHTWLGIAGPAKEVGLDSLLFAGAEEWVRRMVSRADLPLSDTAIVLSGARTFLPIAERAQEVLGARAADLRAEIHAGNPQRWQTLSHLVLMASSSAEDAVLAEALSDPAFLSGMTAANSSVRQFVVGDVLSFAAQRPGVIPVERLVAITALHLELVADHNLWSFARGCARIDPATTGIALGRLRAERMKNLVFSDVQRTRDAIRNQAFRPIGDDIRALIRSILEGATAEVVRASNRDIRVIRGLALDVGAQDMAERAAQMLTEALANVPPLLLWRNLVKVSGADNELALELIRRLPGPQLRQAILLTPAGCAAFLRRQHVSGHDAASVAVLTPHASGLVVTPDVAAAWFISDRIAARDLFEALGNTAAADSSETRTAGVSAVDALRLRPQNLWAILRSRDADSALELLDLQTPELSRAIYRNPRGAGRFVFRRGKGVLHTHAVYEALRSALALRDGEQYMRRWSRQDIDAFLRLAHQLDLHDLETMTSVSSRAKSLHLVQGGTTRRSCVRFVPQHETDPETEPPADRRRPKPAVARKSSRFTSIAQRIARALRLRRTG